MSHPAPNPLPQKPPLGLYGGVILFAAPRRWDEACFSVPALRAIRAARPNCTLGVLCHDEQHTFWQTVPGLNQIIAYDDKTSVRQLLKSPELSRHEWDAGIFWEKGIAAEFFHARKIAHRLAYGEKDLLKWTTEPVPPQNEPGPVVHRVLHYLQFMEKLRIPTQKPELFAPCLTDAPRLPKHVVVCPGSDYGPSHEWSLTRWTEILNLLLDHCHATVTIVHQPDGKSTHAIELSKLFPECRSEKPASFARSLPLLASATLAIAADSSLGHLSAHVGTPTVALFGPNDPHWRRPLGKLHACVRHKVECSPCLLAKCPLDHRCQNELTYAEVAAVILAKWQQLTA